MLGPLLKYARRKGLEPEPGFAPKSARWCIDIASDGRLLGVLELGDPDQKRNPGRPFDRSPELTQPEMKAGGLTKSHFLIDAAHVVALFGAEPDDAKIADKHAYFVRLLREASAALPDLVAAADCLEDAGALAAIRERLEEHRAKPTDKTTIRIGGRFPVESDAWHDWWRTFRERLVTNKRTGPSIPCFATGDLAEPARTHPKIKGLADVGGSSMGSPLIGFDKDAFESYDLKQSANCAVSEQAASAYRAALNDLIAKHSRRLAGAKVVHWFQRAVPLDDDPLPWLDDPSADPEEAARRDAQEAQAQARAQKLLAAIKSGERPDLAANHYYALTLSGSGGRVMVRDWIEGPFEGLVRNVGAWFDDLTIVHREGGRQAPEPKFFAVLGATVRDLDDLAPPFVARMWRVAVANEPIPRSALAQALLRVRAGVIEDEPPSHARMGLIKAYHVRQHREEGGSEMPEHLGPYLNENHPSSAYHCGRLMAVLAGLQRSALGDVGAGVVQRYYAAASSTPALVLGRLDRLSKFHLNALKNPGLAYWYEDKLAAIWQRLGDSVPTTLTLEEQSLFALGYYQQLADLRTKKPGAETDDTPEGEQTNE